MNLAEFNIFIKSHPNGVYVCDLNVYDRNPCRAYRSNGSVKFNRAGVSGNGRAIVFTNPIASLALSGVIHIHRIDGENGTVHFTITCQDDLKGGKYDEKIIWVPTSRLSR